MNGQTLTRAQADRTPADIALDSLSERLSATNSIAEELERRLQPVLRPAIPETERGKDGPKEIRQTPSPMVDAIEHHARSADLVWERLHALLRRLDV